MSLQTCQRLYYKEGHGFCELLPLAFGWTELREADIKAVDAACKIYIFINTCPCPKSRLQKPFFKQK